MNIENLTKVDKERMFETYDLWPEIARDAHEKDFQKKIFMFQLLKDIHFLKQ